MLALGNIIETELLIFEQQGSIFTHCTFIFACTTDILT
ncbi:MAG: hypothetical protein AVDCRST_MAG56-3977 [uncultured Cytophagales bacterium]|uniref:Uncharacterized protein n=1 Tax=uncultured Cytophagales bacterium TaxID=158755 RepID=A0A6J4JPT2_9SPHI|nr:MAG: hypothetical protein AVDCRST_MAG56-3977 [uncultured Cytophagales bacterium]